MADIYANWNAATDGAAALLARVLVPATGLSFSAPSLTAQSGTADVGSASQPLLRSSISFYNGGLSLVDLGPGIVLSSGDSQPGTENTLNIYANGFKTPSFDADMEREAKGAVSELRRDSIKVTDVSSLSGSFTPTDPTVRSVRVDLVYASETYPDLSRDSLGGFAAVFVNGTNHALFNRNVKEPLSLRDENQDVVIDQPVFQVANPDDRSLVAGSTTRLYEFELDAVSRKLTVIAPVVQGSNTLKIAVGDASDLDQSQQLGDIADSALFVAGLQGTRYTNTGLFEVRTGTAGSDVMPGSARREFFEAGAGNDRIAASGGDDIVAAGAGVDTMVLSGVRSDYTLSARAAERMMTVSDRQPGRDGTVDLEQVEVLQFADRKLAIDLTADGGAGQVALTLGVLYPQGLREPAIVGALLGLADAGLDAAAICQRLADGGILAALAGSNQPADIARMAVRNVLKIVEPDAALVSTLAAYMDGRAANYTPAQFLGIVASLELNQVAVNLVGLQQTGLEFV